MHTTLACRYGSLARHPGSHIFRLPERSSPRSCRPGVCVFRVILGLLPPPPPPTAKTPLFTSSPPLPKPAPGPRRSAQRPRPPAHSSPIHIYLDSPTSGFGGTHQFSGLAGICWEVGSRAEDASRRTLSFACFGQEGGGWLVNEYLGGCARAFV